MTPQYITIDRNGKELSREDKGRGRPRAGAEHRADGNWYITEGTTAVKPARTSTPREAGAEVAPAVSPVYIVCRGGVEIRREPKGRGRPRSGAEKRSDGNWYVEESGSGVVVGGLELPKNPRAVAAATPATPAAAVFYVFRDLQGNEIGREQKGRGRTRSDAEQGADGNWYCPLGLRPDDDGPTSSPETLALLDSLRPFLVEQLPKGWKVLDVPAGECPVKLQGIDTESVLKWRDSMRRHYADLNTILSTNAMEYFIIHYRYDRAWNDDRKIAVANLRQINGGIGDDATGHADAA